MSSERKGVEVNLSMASLGWKFSVLPSIWSEKIAKESTFDGLEVLPGYSVCLEYLTLGKLSASPKSIRSIHESWKWDGYIEKKYGLETDTNKTPQIARQSRLIREIFPFKTVTRSVVDGLEKRYEVPVIIHWPKIKYKDVPSYKNPILEVHPYLGMTPNEILHWASQDISRGLAIDVSQRKLWEWINNLGIEEDGWIKVLLDILPYLQEVHFQIANENEANQVLKSEYNGYLGNPLNFIKNNKPDIVVVAEVKSRYLKDLGRDYLKFLKQVAEFIRKA